MIKPGTLRPAAPGGRGSAPASGARRPSRSGGERGHLLLVLMVAITVMLIMLTVAAQSWTFRMRREREVELIFRGEQYVTGLEIWRQKTGGFPVGDLKVLVQKGPDGARTMRKLYKNPFNKAGKWQYLFLHPTGAGYINPCANTGADAFAAQMELVGQIPVSGAPVGGVPTLSGGSLVPPATGLPGQGKGRGRFGRSQQGGMFGGLSAMSPELYEKTIKGMNLAIVGVVNCMQEASIRTYQGQAWLANWAFTPLAQGEFAGQAAPGHLVGGKVNIKSGLGMTGAEVYKDPRDLVGHGGGLVTGGISPNKTPSRGVLRESPGREAGDDGQEEEEDQRYDYQWRRDQGEEDDEDDWRLRRWRRDRERIEAEEEEEDAGDAEDDSQGEEEEEDAGDAEDDSQGEEEDEDSGDGEDEDDDGGDEDDDEDDGEDDDEDD